MTPPRYDRSIPSDGLTRDSRHGPVDLVAAERVAHGHPATLTRADSVHLTGLLTGSHEQAAWVAWALGQPVESVLKRVVRRRKTVTGQECEQ